MEGTAFPFSDTSTPSYPSFFDTYELENCIQNLFFGKCLINEFGCEDGTCISMVKRCNGVADCEFNLDESDCNLVDIYNNTYQKEYPPFQSDGSAISIKISVAIISIGSFEEIGMTFTVKFSILLEWYVCKDYIFTQKCIIQIYVL